MRRRVARTLGPVLAGLLCAGALTACSDDVDTSTDPVEVEVGQAFSWDGFTVDDGWTLEGKERSINGDTVTTPNVKGTVTNTLAEERAAIFEMVFSTDGDPVATISCSAPKMLQDQAMTFECPGLGAIMPDDYDAIVVQEFVRDDGTTSS